jgi:hypothetical protein
MENDCMSLFLFPVPRRVLFKDRTIDYSNARWVKLYPGAGRSLLNAALRFAEDASGLFPEHLSVCAGTPSSGEIFLEIHPCNPAMKPQHYLIRSEKQSISLSAGSEAGLFYGLQTLRQIVRQSGASIPEFEIEDRPDFENRGYMLDVSRCKVPLMEELFDFVNLLAELKYNQLQLYVEHTFAFAAHENVWADSSPFTATELLVLDEYCKERFIDLVPNFNSFGHLERWLKHGEYQSLAECPEGFSAPNGISRRHGGVLRPDLSSLAFLDQLYQEYLPNFSDARFNIGCDETWELGLGWSKELCAKKGSTRVYFDFLLQICALAEKHGRRPMFWGDILLHQPDLIKELPKGITALNWGYEAEHPFDRQTAAFAESGVPFYVCPGTSSWNSLTGRTTNCIDNLLNATKHGIKNGAAGLLMTDWGDGGHHQYPPVSWPGIFAGAAYSWCHEANKHADVADAIDFILANAGGLGKYLMEFGKLYELFEHKDSNGTVYGRALFAELSSPPAFMEKIKPEEIRQALRHLLDLRGHLGEATVGSNRRRLLIDELMNASGMVECALNKMLIMKGEKVDTSALKAMMRHIIRKHEELWLARNRPGGLNESSARLRRVLDDLIKLPD